MPRWSNCHGADVYWNPNDTEVLAVTLKHVGTRRGSLGKRAVSTNLLDFVWTRTKRHGCCKEVKGYDDGKVNAGRGSGIGSGQVGA